LGVQPDVVSEEKRLRCICSGLESVIFHVEFRFWLLVLSVEVLLAPVSVFQSTWALVFVFEFVQEARARSGRRWLL
jgi:hypothetical protein